MASASAIAVVRSPIWRSAEFVAGFDPLRHADQRRPLLRLRATALGLLLGGDLLAPDHVLFKHEHGTGRGEFVTMVLSAYRGRHVSCGKLGILRVSMANRAADRRDDHRQEDQRLTNPAPPTIQ